VKNFSHKFINSLSTHTHIHLLKISFMILIL